MVRVNLDLDDGANQNVELYKGLHRLKSKSEAINKMLNELGDKYIEETLYTPKVVAELKAAQKEIKEGKYIEIDDIDELDEALDNYEKEQKKKKLASKKQGKHGKNKIRWKSL